MPKTCTIFKDIGKACGDLLSKDFGVGSTTVELKTKTSNGMEFTPKMTKKDDSSISGELKAAYGFLPGFAGECTYTTAGSISANVKATKLMPGLELKAECEKSPSSKAFFGAGNLIVDYKQEMFTCKTSYDIYKKDLLASASTVFGALTCGADCAYNTGKGALAKYAFACQFVQPDFIVSAKLANAKGANTASCGYYHKVSPLMQVGVDLSQQLSKPVSPDIAFGCAYKLDGATTVKGKVLSKGNLCLSYKQKISSLTTMTLATQIDINELSSNKHKFGLELNITP